MEEGPLDDVVEAINRKSRDAGSDKEKLLDAISSGAALVTASESVRDTVRDLMERAFLAGVDPRDLYDRPYTKGYVLAIYNDLRREHPELPQMARGPIPRRGRTSRT